MVDGKGALEEWGIGVEAGLGGEIARSLELTREAQAREVTENTL